jgi:hypothetical protein
MQRWGKPEAIIPKHINPQDQKIQNPTPISFYVDYVFQDRVIAEDLIATLKKYGHPQGRRRFSLTTGYRSFLKTNALPILVQTNNDISKKLSKIQWID